MSPARRDPSPIFRLMLFFAVVYTVEGFCQAKVGVVWQPLTHYLKETKGWDAVQIAASLAVLDVPWVVKPLYGIVSDFLPLFGYRRRSYLLLANAGAVAAFLWTTQVLAPGAIVFALLLTAIAMAVASTVCGALLVENGQQYAASAAFINQQWLWFNVAVMAASLLGGELIELLSQPRRLACGGRDRRGRADRGDRKRRRTGRRTARGDQSGRTAAGAARLPRCIPLAHAVAYWRVPVLYYFSPGFGTPLYFHMTDHLRFSQGTIGMLSSVSAGGWIAGGLLYRYALHRMTTRALLNLSIAGGALATLAFLGMIDVASAIAVYFINGVAGMIANIATLTLAAEHCPERSEGFAFAALMSVINLATPLADTIGAFLYEHVFHRGLAPLIVVSALFTAAIFRWCR